MSRQSKAISDVFDSIESSNMLSFFDALLSIIYATNKLHCYISFLDIFIDLSYDYEHPTIATTPKPTTLRPQTTTIPPQSTNTTTPSSTSTAKQTTKASADIQTVDVPKAPGDHVKSWCSTDFILEGVKPAGGLYAGTYRLIGHVESINDCMRHCCESEDCTLAYMVKGTCYTMRCLDRDLCKSAIADSHTSVGYVIRDGWSLFKNAQEAVTDVIFQPADGLHMVPVHNSSVTAGKSDALGTSKSPSPLTLNHTSVDTADTKSVNATKPVVPKVPTNQAAYLAAMPEPEASHGLDFGYCEKGETLRNQRLMGGMKAGLFRDHGEVGNMETCTEYCCRDKECHVAYMVDKSCYSVKCFNSQLCTTFKAPNFFLNPLISFVSRSRNSSGTPCSSFIFIFNNAAMLLL